jgi:hypothetical protein
MTTTDSSFIADGVSRGIVPRATIGFYAKGQPQRVSALGGPFTVGAFAVGTKVGVFGATDDRPLPAGWLRTGGVFGQSAGDGVAGVADWGYGVVGASGGYGYAAGVRGDGAYCSGVVGMSNLVGPQFDDPFPGSGVVGMVHSPGPSPASFTKAGVIGTSDSLPGVVGTSNVVGLYGYCGAPGPMMNAGNGVEGHSANGTGVLGVAGAPGPVPAVVGNIAGVVGSSDQHTGIIGTATNAIGVVGYSETQWGVYAETGATGTGSYAGYFKGNLFVSGRIDAGVKDAIVPFPDGTHRLLHCMESPEHWFEDFGAAKLKRGRAVVKLDANFAKVIKRGDYKVFVTPEGNCRGLYVRKSAASFEVRELGGGMSNVAFSYRIVGRRKDIRGHRRFAKIDVTLPAVPKGRRPLRGKLLASRKGAGRLRRGKRARGSEAAMEAFAKSWRRE